MQVLLRSWLICGLRSSANSVRIFPPVLLVHKCKVFRVVTDVTLGSFLLWSPLPCDVTLTISVCTLTWSGFGNTNVHRTATTTPIFRLPPPAKTYNSGFWMRSHALPSEESSPSLEGESRILMQVVAIYLFSPHDAFHLEPHHHAGFIHN